MAQDFLLPVNAMLLSKIPPKFYIHGILRHAADYRLI